MARAIFSTTAAVVGVGGLLSLRFVGMLSHQALAAALVLGVVWAVASRGWMAWRGGLYKQLLRELRTAEARPHALQLAGRGLFWLVVTVAALWVFPRAEDVRFMFWMVAGLGAVRLAAELLPPKRVSHGPTVVMVAGSLVLLFDLVCTLLPGAEARIVIHPPFHDNWLVLQGGRSALQTHHRAAYNQHWALDLIRLHDGRMLLEDQTGNAQWHSWEQPILAPVNGEVVKARADVEDSEGLHLVKEPDKAAGNVLVIKTAEGLFVVLAHLRRGSLKVAVGDRVTVGQPVARCGNSGNTTSPHLHLQVQTHADLWDKANRSVPFAFTGSDRTASRNDVVRGSATLGEH